MAKKKKEIDPNSIISLIFKDKKITLSTWEARENVGDISKWESHHEMIFQLMEILSEETNNESVKQKDKETLDYLKKHIVTIHAGRTDKGIVGIKYTTPKIDNEAKKREVEIKLNECFGRFCTQYAIKTFLEKIPSSIERYQITVKEYEQKEKELQELEKAVKKLDRELLRKDKLLKKATGKPKRSLLGGKLVDNMLTNYSPIPSLFDSENTTVSTEVKLVNRKGVGINFDKSETKIIMCLCEILMEKSQHTDKAKKDYFIGNKGENTGEIVTRDKEKLDIVVAQISFTLHEIAKKFSGEDNPGGSWYAEVIRILTELADNPEKKSFLRYTRREEGKKKGDYREYFIEGYHSLFNINTVGWKEKKDGNIDTKKEIIVTLHPIFRENINKIAVPVPYVSDIIEANNSPKISTISQKLILELSRAHTNRKVQTKTKEGHSIYTIGIDKLYNKIAPQYMPPHKKRLNEIKEFLDKGIEVAIKVNLLVSYSIIEGTTGTPLYEFILNKDYNK